MDTTEKRIEDFSVMALRSLYVPLLLALSLASLACGGSTPPADTAASQNEGAPNDEGGGAEESAKAAEPPNDTKEYSHGAKKMEGDVVPDDYSLTERDCVELGKQYVAVQRADQVAKLDAKLTEKQREQAMKSIDGVVGKMGDPWANGCIESLAGKVVDRKSLDCAMSSKSVKGFDECLNGPAEPKK
jgi:hypothetical protein